MCWSGTMGGPEGIILPDQSCDGMRFAKGDTSKKKEDVQIQSSPEFSASPLPAPLRSNS